MTTETKTFISVNDIVAVQYECMSCHARFVATVEYASAPPLSCQQCHKQWFVDSTDPRSKDLHRMIQSIKTASDSVARFQGTNVPLSVSLEIASESGQSLI